ncbi:hypothetical protein EG328_009943 [Venturia inaequalis]|uniref:PLAC8-domain-containing protein n=1 Tax=Venturia inaequalis TaxID=5025 RepID=A0A8H3V952_VENIN|nr:hypothetical protein EG328_009943 [Venturia inaequalis]RDI77324.1 hypothetical protein Vi05172_g12683 [Venturia inaequalis]
MATSFLSSTAATASTSDQVARLPEPAIPARSEARVKTESTELPASPVATTKSNEPSDFPASPLTDSTSKIADTTEAAQGNKSSAMSIRKKNWISDEEHNGTSLQALKHDPRAGSGIEFVSPMEEEEGKQLHQASPQNEESSPKYPIPRPESEGLQVLPGQNQGNTAVYLNHDEEEDVGRVAGMPEDDWHYTLCSCWSQSSLCGESLCCPCVLAGRTHQHLHNPPSSNNPYTHIPSTNWYCTSCCLLSIFLLAAAPVYYCMTWTQRREVRYKYHIKGNNANDCCASTFCVCCTLVQEEREVQWRMQQAMEKKKGTGQMERRDGEMKYRPEDA